MAFPDETPKSEVSSISQAAAMFDTVADATCDGSNDDYKILRGMAASLRVCDSVPLREYVAISGLSDEQSAWRKTHALPHRSRLVGDTLSCCLSTP
jgi:hypothetical protein